jgi:methylglutamate dehydrogenase subunit D
LIRKETVTVVDATLTNAPLGSGGAALHAPSALRSPFLGHTAGERPNAAGQIGVQLTASVLPSVTLISTWISGLPGLLEAMATVFGAALPTHTGKTMQTALGLLLRSGPEEFVLLGADATDRCTLLRAPIGADIGAVTDLSHARCRIHITGTACRSTLNKLFALDLREARLAIGDVALTGTHHVPSMLHRLGVDAFDLYVFSTYAHDQLGTLLDAALEYGVVLQLP